MKLQRFKEQLQQLWEKVTQIDDTPHAIAMGAAVGIGWNFIPSLGVGPVLSVVCAKALGASGIAAVTVNLGTGLLIPMLYSLNLVTGRFLAGQWFTRPELEKYLHDSYQHTLENIEMVVEEPARFFSLSSIGGVGVDFFLGGILNAVFAGAVLYSLIWLPTVLRRRIAQVRYKN